MTTKRRMSLLRFRRLCELAKQFDLVSIRDGEVSIRRRPSHTGDMEIAGFQVTPERDPDEEPIEEP